MSVRRDYEIPAARPPRNTVLIPLLLGFVVSAAIGITLLFTVNAAGSAQIALIFWLTPPFTFLFWLIRRRRSRGRESRRTNEGAEKISN